MAKKGKIFLEGMSYLCRIGCTTEERAFPQSVTIDLEIGTDLEAVISTGKLEAGICWATADQLIAAVVTETEWVLVEQLADAVCDTLFERFEPATAIAVRIKKFVFAHGKSVGVELRRERG